MKKIILSAILLSPLALLAQSDFTLKGNTKVTNGNKIYLVYAENGQRLTDSAIVANGAFEFKGKVTSPVMGNVFNNVNPYKKGASTKNMDYTALYIEPGNITLNSVDSLKSAVAGGTQVNIDNTKLSASLKSLTDQEKALNEEYSKYTKEQKEDKAVMDTLIGKFGVLRDQKTPLYLKFVKENPKSYISLVQLNVLAGNDKVVNEQQAKEKPVEKSSSTTATKAALVQNKPVAQKASTFEAKPKTGAVDVKADNEAKQIANKAKSSIKAETTTTDVAQISHSTKVNSFSYIWIGIFLIVAGVVLGLLFGKPAFLISFVGIVFITLGLII